MEADDYFYSIKLYYGSKKVYYKTYSGIVNMIEYDTARDKFAALENMAEIIANEKVLDSSGRIVKPEYAIVAFNPV